MNWVTRNVSIEFYYCCFRDHSTSWKSKSIFWRNLAATHHTGATADLLAEAEVPSVASDTNVRTSLSGDPPTIFSGAKSGSVQKRLNTIVWPNLTGPDRKELEKIGPQRPRKIGKEPQKRVRLAEHLAAEEPIQRWSAADKCSLYMCAKFRCSDAKDLAMVDD